MRVAMRNTRTRSTCLSLVLGFLTIATTLFTTTPAATQADDQLILVSSFASGESGSIQAFLLDTDKGTLTPKAKYSQIENPFFLALSPDQKTLYSIHAPGKFGGGGDEFVMALRIVNEDGALSEINRQTTKGTASCYLDVSPDGKTAVVANYSSGNVASYSIGQDGALGKPASFIQHAGSSVNEARQKGPHAHCIVLSPNGKHIFAADLGIDKIVSYTVDDSRLVAGRQPFVRTAPGTGPRHLTFHPDGKRVFVVNEIGNTVTGYGYDATNGFLSEHQTISTLPEDFEETTHTADIKITPNGKFLYATNRGHDSVAAYRFKGNDLHLVNIEPSLGKGPQNLAIVGDGKFLLCANLPGNNLIVFKIDQTTGQLSAIGDPVSIPSPSCIMAIR